MINGGLAFLQSSSPQCLSSASSRVMWPFEARAGTRCRWAGMLPAVQACQRSSVVLTSCLCLYLEQLVSDARRGFEIEVRRRLTHLRLELRDQRRQILIAIVSARFRDAATLLLLALLALAARVRHAGDESHLVHALLHTHRGDSMLAVVFLLDRAATARFLDAPLHGAGHPVSIEDGASVEMPRRAPDCLDERTIAAQK